MNLTNAIMPSNPNFLIIKKKSYLILQRKQSFGGIYILWRVRKIKQYYRHKEESRMTKQVLKILLHLVLILQLYSFVILLLHLVLLHLVLLHLVCFLALLDTDILGKGIYRCVRERYANSTKKTRSVLQKCNASANEWHALNQP